MKQYREALLNAPWEDGRLTAGHLAASAKNNMQLPADHPLTAEIGDQLLDALARNPRFMAATLPLRVLPPRFNRYEGGGNYDMHVDSATTRVWTTMKSDPISTCFKLSSPATFQEST